MERGKIDCLDSGGASTLLYASHSLTVKKFVESQANLTFIDFKGRNFFHYPNHLTREYLNIFSENLSQEDINGLLQKRDIDGKTPFEVWFERSKGETVNRASLGKVYSLLIEYGWSPSPTEKEILKEYKITDTRLG